MVGWLLVGLAVAAVLGGYVAFASFLVDQIVWLTALAGLLYLAFAACDTFLGGTLRDNSRISTLLQTNLGLRRKSLQQLGVLLSGVGRLVLAIVATLLALAPWGIESGDFASTFRAAFFGFKVGDVTISLSTIIAALALFFGVIAFSRLIQRWLTGTFLPTTDLDAGLRNSVGTATGYLGFFAAAAAAFSYLGLSLEKIAIVAGALSVGIGFGLQSIVNNFVSGLILLWERPIRVGDLVVVGDGEGYVRRISVRATEIETFDRATIVVPNSNLISGVVKNRVRNDATGRVVLPVNVLRNQDPARAAELLLACANDHPDVLKEPPSRVIFKKIGDTWLEFDLVCYVDDVTKQLRVQSDLNFALFGTLVREGILPPLGPGAMNVGGLEPVQAALKQIAEAIGAASPNAAPGSAVPPPVRASP
jgi:small-conductance mechanosensitive channel